MNETLGNPNTANDANSTSSPDLHVFPRNFIVFWIVTYYVLLGCGAFLNLVVVYVMLRSRKIRTSISSFLMFHLSLTHVLYHVAVPLLRQNDFNNSPHSCKAFVLMELSCAAAIFSSLAAIAWDRQRNILQPFKSLAPRRLKTYLVLLTAIWIYSLVSSTPFIYSVRTKTQEICWKAENGTKKCEKYAFCHSPIDWETQLSKTLYFIMAFIVPFMYMLVTYTKIAVSLWKRSKTGKIHGAVAKCKAKTIRLMVTALLVFAVCWGSNFTVDLLRVYGLLKNLSLESDVMLRIWCLIAQASSSCLNPIIYAFFSPEFRKNCFKFCCCCFSCCMYFCRLSRYSPNRVQPAL